MKENVLYRETQRNQKAWVLAVVGVATLATAGLFSWAIVQQVFLGIPWGTKPLPNGPLLITAVLTTGVMVLICWVINSLRLEIRITADEVAYGLFPLTWKLKSVPRTEIQTARTVSINPMKDFGGYGIRYGRLGKGYLMNCTQGVHLTFFQGPTVTLSSNNPDEIVKVLGFGGR